MATFLDFILDASTGISGFIWGLPMVVLLFGTGLLLTMMTGFVQFRNFYKSARLVLLGAIRRESKEGAPGEPEGEGDISPFQALMTALSATVGNGNIAGVATAIAAGGPGAAFWMWITAVFGMATKYSEAVLAILYRRKMPDGTMAGGPMYYCRYGIRFKTLGAFLGGLFALCGGIATLMGTGNMFQSQSIASAARQQFDVPEWASGFLISFFVGLVIIGGIKRIAVVAERMVPGMILFYFGGTLLVILNNIGQIPSALQLIVHSAFSPQAAMGGAIGIGVQQAIRFGVARGILSNESGLGSAAIAHGAARTRFPVVQGGIAMMGTFIDTIVVCTLTALTIVVSGAYLKATFMVDGIGLSGADLTVHAFNTGMPDAIAGYGGAIVVFSSLIFGFTTLLGWSYYGQICFEYLFGLKVVKPYRVVFIVLLFVGAQLTGTYAPIITNVGDICNALMAFPNLVGLIFLSGVVAKVTHDSYRAGRMRVHEAKPMEPPEENLP